MQTESLRKYTASLKEMHDAEHLTSCTGAYEKESFFLIEGRKVETDLVDVSWNQTGGWSHCEEA